MLGWKVERRGLRGSWDILPFELVDGLCMVLVDGLALLVTPIHPTIRRVSQDADTLDLATHAIGAAGNARPVGTDGGLLDCLVEDDFFRGRARIAYPFYLGGLSHRAGCPPMGESMVGVINVRNHLCPPRACFARRYVSSIEPSINR